jgi:hypothetical protein
MQVFLVKINEITKDPALLFMLSITGLLEFAYILYLMDFPDFTPSIRLFGDSLEINITSSKIWLRP